MPAKDIGKSKIADKTDKKKRIVVNLRKEEDKQIFEQLKSKWELQFDYEVLLECFRFSANLTKEGLILSTIEKENFDKLKEESKLSNDVDVLRIIISRYFEMENNKISIEPTLDFIIDDFLKSKYHNMKYGIFSKSDFVNRAVLKFIESVRNEINLHNATFRSSLPDKEKILGQILIDMTYRLSSKAGAFGLTFDNIMKEIETQNNTITKEEVNFILNSFANRQLITIEEFKRVKYYSIPL